MNELENRIWTEKYRPQEFEDLILKDKETITKYLDNPETIPSFIFYSSSPGTGKTTTAKLIIKYLECDSLMLNSSDERGIDTIREKIKTFARSLPSSGIKRCIFLDESEQLTGVAQKSLKNIIETYSDNCFFIFTANDISKIVKPIRSRCVNINFSKPSKQNILERLDYICTEEDINTPLGKLIDYYYPDIRKMIVKLQQMKNEGKEVVFDEEDYEIFLTAMRKGDINYIYQKTYSETFDIMPFNNWLFEYIFDHQDEYSHKQLQEIAQILAETEKNWNLGVNLPIIFISNILKVSKLI